MTDPHRSSRNASSNVPERQGILPPGAIIPSTEYPGGRSIVVEEQADMNNRSFTGERVTRDWEYVTVARPVDMHEKVYEVPTKRTVQTVVPRVQVREVIKTIRRDEPVFIEKEVEIPHTKIVDKYVEVPVVSGTEVKYVPKIEVQERTVKVTKPEIKWVEKVIEVPQIKEVVRYVESDKNVEQVIRYVAKGQKPIQPEAGQAPAMQDVLGKYGAGGQQLKPSEYKKDLQASGYSEVTGAASGIYTPRSTVPLSQEAGSHVSQPSQDTYLPRSPRLDRMEQLFIPRVTKTVEVEKEIPVTIDVPVPFMVPKPVQVPVEVPVLKFRDHFVPVPVRRHVIPRIIFTEEVYEVDCTREKPVLVVEDYFKPVPVDVKIKLKEKDIKVIPIDPSELSQSDFHAMWMRVNADLLERARASNHPIKLYNDDEDSDEPIPEDETPEQLEERLRRREERRKAREDEDVKDPTLPDFGPLPLHPGHPLMMTYLQSQWIQNPSTVTHNMYTPEFFRMHTSALDSLLNPQPHQVNITHEQVAQLGPLPAEQMPSPWSGSHPLSEEARKKKAGEVGRVEGSSVFSEEQLESEEFIRQSMCSPCCASCGCASGCHCR